MEVPPLWIARFAKLLRDRRPVTWSTVVGSRNLRAELGIREILQYSERKMQLLGRNIEYRVVLTPYSWEIPLSCQLYSNKRYHWRLFLFTKASSPMLLSVNLTTIPPSDRVALRQTMKIFTQRLSPSERVWNRDALVECLQREGFTVRGNDLELGTYDRQAGSFTDTTPEHFIMDFLRAGLIKGHFMANKSYRFPWLSGF